MNRDATEIDVFLCRHRAEWPLHVFESESHTREWLRTQSPDYAVIHRAKIVIGDELELVEPVPFFQSKGS